MVDDQPRNQKVTLSTETIEKLNQVGDGGQAYDTIIQDLCNKELENKDSAANKRRAAAQEKENAKVK